jgi:ribonuclease-3
MARSLPGVPVSLSKSSAMQIDSIGGISYRFENPQLLTEALTHRSIGSINYERLEFLGDSVLNLVISYRLFELRPDAREGDLSRMRARLVRGTTLAKIAAGINLGKYLNLGEGERKSGGFRRASILADAFEAILGAIFLDGGYDACRAEILRQFDPLIEDLPEADDLKDPKTRLQEWLQALGRPLPQYDLVREEGADHAKQFTVQVRLTDDPSLVEATGGSRRKAEQAAAAAILEQLRTVG